MYMPLIQWQHLNQEFNNDACCMTDSRRQGLDAFEDRLPVAYKQNWHELPPVLTY